jgi:MFS family permease
LTLVADRGDAFAEKQAMGFLLLYALASAGGAVAYVPFLTIVLPSHVTAFAGEGSLSLLAYITFAGAISASISNILFGWASDLSGTRRPWIAAGLLLSCLLLVQIRELREPYQLIGLIIIWQAFLNMMLAPLSAWAGDCVPDGQKGLLGGLLALTPALGATSGILITWGALVPVDQRLHWIAGLTLLCVLPVLIFGNPRRVTGVEASAVLAELPKTGTYLSHTSARRMWAARLLVQIAEASLFAFLLLWFRSIDPAFEDNRVATIFTAVLTCAVIIALLLGRWSDRHDRPLTPLSLSALAAALGLVLMAAADTMVAAIIGYALFGMAGSVFLALHSSQTLRVLTNARRRGRDLGIFNLTNTVPSIVMPWLTLALVPLYGFDALFIVLALLALGAAALLWHRPGQA